MLVDPFGDRMVPGDSPRKSQGRVNFLVEVADPSEAPEFGYTINGLLVSDFYTPQYFDPVRNQGVRYSFTGAIEEPRQVLRGGYLSWQDPVSNHFFQLNKFKSDEPEFTDLGKLTAGMSARAFVDRQMAALTAAALQPGRKVATMAGVRVDDEATEAQAKAWEEQMADLDVDDGFDGDDDRSGNATLRTAPRMRRGK
jgi:hypothetical protein